MMPGFREIGRLEECDKGPVGLRLFPSIKVGQRATRRDRSKSSDLATDHFRYYHSSPRVAEVKFP